MSKLIAIDFDETITDHSPYPIMGPIRPCAEFYIKKLYEKGYTLALWTCRSGIYLQEAEFALKTAGIRKCFKYINDDGRPGIHRKIIADFYIDDRSCVGEINWKDIYDYILLHYPLEESNERDY